MYLVFFLLLPGKIRQECNIRHHVGLRRHRLLGGKGLPPGIQHRRQLQILDLQIQFPTGTVGILNQLQRLLVGNQILGNNAAFRPNMAFFVQFHLHTGGHQLQIHLGIAAVLG